MIKDEKVYVAVEEDRLLGPLDRKDLKGNDPHLGKARLLVDSLIRERTAQGLTQREVAERMGVGQSTISQLESGKVDPRLSTLQRYASAVNVILEFELELPPVKWLADE